MSNPEISFLNNSDIDREKWDQCIARSAVSTIYSQSGYLDLVAPNWDALIMGDYSYIMPLNIKRKLGMNFLLQPIFAQQHGISPEAVYTIQNIFLKYIHNHFRYVAINLNAAHTEPFPEGYIVSQRDNFILNLSPAYEELKKNFSKHARRQIRKAEDQKVAVVRGLQSEEYLNLKNLATGNKLPKKSMQTLQRLIEFCHTNGNGTIYAAYDDSNNLCAAAFFLFAGKRIIYLNAASGEEGKNNSSMYRIIDQFIKEHSSSPITLDFEGSTIPGIARFYKGFGAEPEQYYGLKMNRLPIPLRWFIK